MNHQRKPNQHNDAILSMVVPTTPSGKLDGLKETAEAMSQATNRVYATHDNMRKSQIYAAAKQGEGKNPTILDAAAKSIDNSSKQVYEKTNQARVALTTANAAAKANEKPETHETPTPRPGLGRR